LKLGFMSALLKNPDAHLVALCDNILERMVIIRKRFIKHSDHIKGDIGRSLLPWLPWPRVHNTVRSEKLFKAIEILSVNGLIELADDRLVLSFNRCLGSELLKLCLLCLVLAAKGKTKQQDQRNHHKWFFH